MISTTYNNMPSEMNILLFEPAGTGLTADSLPSPFRPPKKKKHSVDKFNPFCTLDNNQ
jgi:hypothetical protein